MTLVLLGRPLVAVYPAVPLLQGHGLSIGALSYRGRLHACVYADAEVVPDAVEIARDLERGFDALRVGVAGALGEVAPAGRGETPWQARARAKRAGARRR